MRKQYFCYLPPLHSYSFCSVYVMSAYNVYFAGITTIKHILHKQQNNKLIVKKFGFQIAMQYSYRLR